MSGNTTNESATPISEYYSEYNWHDTPSNDQGKNYFQKACLNMVPLLKQPWIEQLKSKTHIRILELGCGAGYGGIALAKAIMGWGLDVSLTLSDIRQDMLDVAVSFAKQEGVKSVKGMPLDVIQWDLDDTFDICLLYGLSTPHFDPWQMVGCIRNVANSLDKDGLFVVHDTDRRLLDFVDYEYQKVALAGHNSSDMMVSLHTGYNIKRGTISRAYHPVNRTGKPITTQSYFWGIAELGALLWTAFKDVDLIGLGECKYFHVAGYPLEQGQLASTMPTALA